MNEILHIYGHCTVISSTGPNFKYSNAGQAVHSVVQYKYDFISQKWTIHPMNAPAPSIEIYVRGKFENIPKGYKRFGIARTIMGILGRCKIRRINVANNFKSSLKPTTLLVSTVIFIFPIFNFIIWIELIQNNSNFNILLVIISFFISFSSVDCPRFL